jgi:DHA1 family bicyclomycin/chloramphenicol resistance-like MFS transporter
VFAALAVAACAMVVGVLLRVPESLPAAARHGTSLGATRTRTLDLLRDPVYMRHVVVQCVATMAFFTYIGGSSFALQQVYGISQRQYAALFTVNAVCMVLTSIVFRLLVGRVGSPPLRRAGLALATTASGGLLIVAIAGTSRIATIAAPWVLLSCVTGGMGLMIPSSISLFQEAGRRYPGTASALGGGLVFLSGAVVMPISGLLGDDTLVPMAALMAGFYLLSALVLAAWSRDEVVLASAPSPTVLNRE